MRISGTSPFSPLVLSATFLAACQDPTSAVRRETPAAAAFAKALDRIIAVDLGLGRGLGLNDRGDVAGVAQGGATLWIDGAALNLVQGTGLTFTRALAVNERRDVVVWSQTNNGESIYLWRDGQLIPLGSLGGPSTRATAINRSGDIVGDSDTPGGTPHAYLWRDGTMADVGASAGAARSWATDINDRGVVIGYAESTPGQFDLHGFIWRDGVVTPIEPAPGFVSTANAVNDRGEVIGNDHRNTPGETRAWVYRNGVKTELPTLPGGQFTVARAINNHGDIAGDVAPASTAPGPLRAVLWRDGQIIDIHVPGASFSTPLGISDRGQVLLRASFPARFPRSQTTWLWEDGRHVELPGLGPTDDEPTAINARGEATGMSAGQAVLWTSRTH